MKYEGCLNMNASSCLTFDIYTLKDFKNAKNENNYFFNPEHL